MAELGSLDKMARLVLQIFFIGIGTALAQSLSNDSATDSLESSAAPSQDKLESQVFQVSPSDIENNTGPFMRSESSLNRLLALSNPPNLQINGGLETDLNTLSIDNLAKQIGVTAIEPNPLQNFNNLNAETTVQANEPILQQQTSNVLDLNALQSQSLDDYRNPNLVLTQPQNTYQVNSNPYQINLNPYEVNPYQVNTLTQNYGSDNLQQFLNNPQGKNQYTLTKVYQSPAYTTLLTDTDESKLLNSVQTLLNQPTQVQSQRLTNAYQLPSTLVADTINDQYQTLLTDVNNDQSLNLDQSLLGQTVEVANEPGLGELHQIPNAGLNTEETVEFDQLLGQQVDLPNLQRNLQQTGLGNSYDSLSSLLQPSTNNQETQVVFNNFVPNLHLPNCKAAFGALLQNAYVRYLKLAKLPYCQQSGFNPYPSSDLPFKIVVVPSNTDWQTNTNSLLPKLLWALLNRLKNQPVGPNQPDSIVPILLQLILQPVVRPPNSPSIPEVFPDNFPNNNNNLFPEVFPDNFPDNNNNNLFPDVFPNNFPNNNLFPDAFPSNGQLFPDNITPLPSPTPNPNLSYLLFLLNLLKNKPQNPSNAYLYKVILDIIKKNSPNNESQIPISQFPNWEFPYDQFPDFNPTPAPLPLPDNLPVPVPLPSIDDQTLPSPIPTPLPDVTELSNPTAKYVILILQKYLPQQQFSVPDLLYLIELINTLPKSLNELMLNPQLLKQVILQLSLRNLNPKLVLGIIYNHLIHLSNPNVTNVANVANLVNPDSNRVVVLKYQVRRQPPFVYQPYYYVLYKLPYSQFVKYLYELLLVKPYLKQNRALLLKELLVLAMTNNNAVSDLNGISKEVLVKLITNQGATPLDVKVVKETDVFNEQLKVVNDVNSQIVTESTIVANAGQIDSSLLGETSGSNNLWAYLLQQQMPGQSLSFAEVTTNNPYLQLLRRSNNQDKGLQNNDPLSELQGADVEVS